MEKTYKIGINALVIKGNQVLMGKRLTNPEPGAWGFPGGKFETGEHFEDCLKRELYEETGLIAEDVEFTQLLNDLQKDEHWIQINFLVKKWSGNLEVKEPTKCGEWKWFDLDNLPENIFFGHSKFLPAYKNNIHFIS